MEKRVNENSQNIGLLKEKSTLLFNEITKKRNILSYYEKEFEVRMHFLFLYKNIYLFKCLQQDLITNIEDTCWRITKTETVLKSEKEYLSQYEHLFEQENKSPEPDVDLHIIESNISIANWKEKKDDLEKNVSKNNELIDKLLKELNHIERECDILHETIYKSKITM